MQVWLSTSVPIFLSIFLIFFITEVNAEVWIPENELIGYFDSNSIYTVVGAVKNSEDFAILPTVKITILDGHDKIVESYELITIMPSKDLPFKFKFPQLTGNDPIIEKAEVTYIQTPKREFDVQVIYDPTLKKHDDGHLTGRIINNGTTAASNIKVLALIHGMNGELLDVGQNTEMISKLEPGEIREFSMYPDPSIISPIQYYSCFALGDETIINVTTTRSGEKFDYRYDSGNWFSYAEFNEKGNELSMHASNSWPIDLFASFEFPVYSINEKFQVFLNEKPVDFIQSIDKMGNWHVAFIMGPRENGKLVITGFEEKDETVKDKLIELYPQFIEKKPTSYKEIFLVESPLKQIKKGIIPKNVICKPGFELLTLSDKPVCVIPTTALKLIERGWVRV